MKALAKCALLSGLVFVHGRDYQQKASLSVQLHPNNSNCCSLAYSSPFLQPQLDLLSCYHFDMQTILRNYLIYLSINKTFSHVYTYIIHV